MKQIFSIVSLVLIVLLSSISYNAGAGPQWQRHQTHRHYHRVYHHPRPVRHVRVYHHPRVVRHHVYHPRPHRPMPRPHRPYRHR